MILEEMVVKPCQSNSGSGSCVDGYEYQMNYSSPCSGGEYTFTFTDVNTGEVVWTGTDENCYYQMKLFVYHMEITKVV